MSKSDPDVDVLTFNLQQSLPTQQMWLMLLSMAVISVQGNTNYLETHQLNWGHLEVLTLRCISGLGHALRYILSIILACEHIY